MRPSQHLSLLIAAVAISPMFVSCDAAADFWDEQSFSVAIPAGGPLSADGADQWVDLSTHPEVSSKLKQLKDVTVAEIWVDVPSVDPSNVAKLANGKLNVQGPNEGDMPISVGSYTGLPIVVGGKIEIIPDPTVVEKIKGWAINGGKFKISYHGDFDAVPANFTVHARVHLIVTAGL